MHPCPTLTDMVSRGNSYDYYFFDVSGPEAPGKVFAKFCMLITLI